MFLLFQKPEISFGQWIYASTRIPSVAGFNSDRGGILAKADLHGEKRAAPPIEFWKLQKKSMLT